MQGASQCGQGAAPSEIGLAGTLPDCLSHWDVSHRARRDITASYHRLVINDNQSLGGFYAASFDAILAQKPAQIHTAHQNSSHSLVKGQCVELRKFVDEFVDNGITLER